MQKPANTHFRRNASTVCVLLGMGVITGAFLAETRLLAFDLSSLGRTRLRVPEPQDSRALPILTTPYLESSRRHQPRAHVLEGVRATQPYNRPNHASL